MYAAGPIRMAYDKANLHPWDAILTHVPEILEDALTVGWEPMRVFVIDFNEQLESGRLAWEDQVGVVHAGANYRKLYAHHT